MPAANVCSSCLPMAHTSPSHNFNSRILLAGRRAGVPLWPVVCSMPQGGGEVKSWQSMKICKKLGSWQPRSGRKTLYFPGELWHLSPEQSGGRRYAPQLARRLRPPAARADITAEALAVMLGLRGKSPMQSFDKFGVVGNMKNPRLGSRRF